MKRSEIRSAAALELEQNKVAPVFLAPGGALANRSNFYYAVEHSEALTSFRLWSSSEAMHNNQERI